MTRYSYNAASDPAEPMDDTERFDEADCCPHGVPFDEICEECEADFEDNAL